MPAAVVLAGGRSSRFGRDKLAATLDGEPLLVRAVDAVRAAGADPIHVVLAPGDTRRLPDGALPVHDPTAFDGPLAGVAAGLATLDADRAMVVGGDMPTLVPAVLAALVAALDDPGIDAACLHDGERLRPLPLAVRVAPAHELAVRLLAGGERRLRVLPEQLSVVALPRVTWQRLDPDGGTLRDVDVAADLPA